MILAWASPFKHPLICFEMDSILATTSWDMDYTL